MTNILNALGLIFILLIYAIGAVIVIMFISAIFYLATGIGKKFYHDILKWHKPNNIRSFDGCSCHSTCKYCGKEIMQDSQGNWF